MKRGFTIVELLVVVGVVAVLMGLLLPAVQYAREASRSVTCQNNVKQIGLGLLSHESQHRRFPSNGWGFYWYGDPDRGTDRHQPGGWIYNVLEFVEMSGLRAAGKGKNVRQKGEGMTAGMQQPIPLFNCPTRHRPALLPQSGAIAFHNAIIKPTAAKTDYAINAGDVVLHSDSGPKSLREGDDPRHRWQDTSKVTGVAFLRSELSAGEIADGLSSTYLVGEKHVCRSNYDDAGDGSHDQGLFCGVDWDINRWTVSPPMRDGDHAEGHRFGSAHAGGCFIAFCDGRVERIGYEIDKDVHRRQGNRQDSK